MFKRIFIFLALNFAALFIGSLYTKTAVLGEWYTHLNKAPWTPPGYMFGLVWTIIMICFAIYISILWSKVDHKTLLTLYVIQWVLNVSWNPIFFYFEWPILALFTIIILTGIIGLILLKYHKILQFQSTLLLPYFIWLFIAVSLNTYIVLHN